MLSCTLPDTSGNPMTRRVEINPCMYWVLCWVDAPVNRNDLCPCGSRHKYKKCCLLRLAGYARAIRNVHVSFGYRRERSFYLTRAPLRSEPLP